MSNLEELIERLCPDGVEYESLICVMFCMDFLVMLLNLMMI